MLFSLFVCHLSGTLFSISSLKTGVSRAPRSSQDSDYEKGYSLGLLPMTPFSDFYLKVIYSFMPLLHRIWNVFGHFDDCYLFGSVLAHFFFFQLPKAAFYEDI